MEEYPDGERFALIINLKKDREGATFDDCRLNKVLKDCHFSVDNCTNFSQAGIRKAVEDFKSKLQDFFRNGRRRIGACFLFIMGHGREGDMILCEDVGPNEILLNLEEDFVAKFNMQNSPFLQGVPKVFIVNFCRGDLEDRAILLRQVTCDDTATDYAVGSRPGIVDAPQPQPEPGPSSALNSSITRRWRDTYLAYSSWGDILIGFPSYFRHKCHREMDSGTWYIKAFCDAVENFGHLEIRQMLIKISKEISSRPSDDWKMQQPCYKDCGFSKKFHLKSNKNTPLRFGVVNPGKQVYGRNKEYNQLMDVFTKCEHTLLLVSGIGGQGKTGLIRKFLSNFQNMIIHLLWIHGETVETLSQDLKQLSREQNVNSVLNNQDEVLDAKTIFKRIFEYLKHNLTIESTQNPELPSRKWIFVIDNVDEDYDELFLVLRALKDTFGIEALSIVTSRKRNILKNAKCFHIELKELDEEDAIKFVSESLDGFDITQCKALCKAHQNFPLGLSQSVAFIKERRRDSTKGHQYDVNDWLRQFKQETQKVHDYRLSPVDEDYTKTTFLIMNVTFEAIYSTQPVYVGQFASKLMMMLSYMEPDGVKIEFLRMIFKTMGGPMEIFEEAIELLKIYSLITITDLVISVHRSVQDVMRLRCKIEKMEHFCLRKMLKEGINPLLQGSLDFLTPEKVRSKQEEMSHVLKIWESAKAYEEFNDFYVVICYRLLRLRHPFAFKFFGRNIHCFSRKGLENLVNSNNIILNYDISMSTSTVKSQNLRDSQKVLDNFYRNRVKLYESDLFGVQTEFDNKKTVEVKILIAQLLITLKDYHRALERYKDIVKWQEKYLGFDHASTLQTMFEQAVCFYCLNQEGDVDNVFRKLITIKNTMLEVLESFPSGQGWQ